MLNIRKFNFLNDVYNTLFMELRASDVKEILDFTGEAPTESLARLISFYDELFVVEDDYERILGIFGIIPDNTYLTENVGEVFFLATQELIYDHTISFIRQSKEVIDLLLLDYDVLYNYVSSENKKSIRWLKWLGFKVFENKEVYFENPKVPFYFFKLERS